MKLSQIKHALSGMPEVNFVLPTGEKVPSHFHVTEIGSIQKHFIDCGGTVRKESVINFQLFTASDYDHRLSADKLRSIIELSEDQLDLDDQEIEVEYQGDTIGKYGLDLKDGVFHLTRTETDCLAKDKCGIPQDKPKVLLADLQNRSCCAPDSGCC